MDEVIFEEFKGTGNQQIALDRACSKTASSRLSISSARQPAKRSCFCRGTLNRVDFAQAAIAVERGRGDGVPHRQNAQGTKTNEEFLESMNA